MADLSRKAGASQTVSNHWVMVAWTSRCCSIRRGFPLDYVFEILLMHRALSRAVRSLERSKAIVPSQLALQDRPVIQPKVVRNVLL
jgi:hypothetical protein